MGVSFGEHDMVARVEGMWLVLVFARGVFIYRDFLGGHVPDCDIKIGSRCHCRSGFIISIGIGLAFLTA